MSKLISLLVLIAAFAAVWFWVLRPVLNPISIGRGTGPQVVSQPTNEAAVQQQDNALRAAVAGQAAAFLTRWQQRKYAAMYAMLDRASQQGINKSRFTQRYGAIATEATMTGISYHIMSTTVTPPEATVGYYIHITTTQVGIIDQSNQMQLQQEHGAWHVHWQPSLIFKQLHDPYYVHMIPADPVRGAIYDRAGQPLAGLGYKVRIDVVPAWINNKKELVSFLSNFLHMTSAAINARFLQTCNPTQTNQDTRCTWRYPIGYVTDATLKAASAQLTVEESNGIDSDFVETPIRIYPNGSLASQVLGYVQNGHGQLGMEAVENSVLSGKQGYTLAVTDRPADDATVIARIAQRLATPGADLHLTLDLNLQRAAEAALGTTHGAVVAIDPRDGSILAMVSHPGFDPNAFSSFGVSPDLYAQWNSASERAFFNRATSGTYPLGSIFKIVSMAAAMTTGIYGEHAPLFNSTGTWSKLGWQYVKHDWEPNGHGLIDLHEALVQSCDDCFYDVGLQLYQKDPDALSAMGRAFGFGSPTGVQGLDEAAGTMPGPAWKKAALGQGWWTGDDVNLAIGQGYLLVTPLQVAHMLATVADNGTVYTPYLISTISRPDGTVLQKTHPAASTHVPVSKDTFAAIQRGMLGVTTEPFGTGITTFRNYQYSVLGKTGTAEAPGTANPEAWFAAITPSSTPRLALAVLVENGGEGAQVAAPIAKQIITAFYKYTDVPPKPQPAVLTVP